MADRNEAAGPPTGALQSSDGDRKRDYRQGRADARSHLPLVSRQPGAGGAAAAIAPPRTDGNSAATAIPAVEPTPFLTELFHRRNQFLAELYETYIREQTRLLDELRDAEGRRDHLLTVRADA